MLRKLLFGTHRAFRSHSTVKNSKRGSRVAPLRRTALGLECLESRSLLSASLALDIEADQFFGVNLSHVPFRAMFTDVREATDPTYTYTINWGDGETTGGQTLDFIGSEPGDPILGRIEEFHEYDGSQLQYTVTVTLEDGLDNSDESSTDVDVYDVGSLEIGVGSAEQTLEGVEFSLNLPNAPPDSTWRINWGDVIEDVLANGSAEHVYADDVNLTEFPATHTISAALFTPNDGTFYADGPWSLIVQDVSRTLSISGNADVNEGDSYTLNILSSDPGTDPIVDWIVYWQNTKDTESNPELLPDFDGAEQFFTDLPSTAPKVYAEPGSFLVRLDAVSDDGFGVISNLLSVTVLNVDPTADAGGPYVVTDETPFLLQGTISDPGGSSSLEFEWDLDGDSIFGETGVDASRGDETVEDPLFDPTGIVGTFNVTLRVTDEHGGEDVDTAEITVQQTDGVFLVGGILSVIDSNAANDIVSVSQSGGNISVTINGNTIIPPFIAGDVNEIKVELGSGHDIVVIGSNITVPVTIDGGDGNDFLVGGGGRSVLSGGNGNDILWGAAGDDVLLGGAGNDDLFGGGGNDALVGGFGNDIITGGSGRDLVIGSQNQDLLLGGDGEDILIGGFTAHDGNVAALDLIMATWGSAASFSSRVATLTGSGGLLEANVSVFDDDALDLILGGAGRDLVFGNTNPADGAVDLLALNAIQDVLKELN